MRTFLDGNNILWQLSNVGGGPMFFWRTQQVIPPSEELTWTRWWPAEAPFPPDVPAHWVEVEWEPSLNDIMRGEA